MRLPLTALVLLAGACKKPEAPPPEPAVVTVPVVAAPASPYEADCGHIFLAAFDDMGERGEKNECEARDFEQNCAPDLDGCSAAEEKCKDACGKPACLDCQSKCTTACTDCRTSQTPAACAAAREACRQGCLKARDTCRDVTCPAEAKACSEKADAVRKEKCPTCEEIKSCYAAQLYGPGANGKEWSEVQKKADAACKKVVGKEPECAKLCQPEP